MALTEHKEVDRHEVLQDGTIQERTALVIKRDGKEISRSFINRRVYHQGADMSEAEPVTQQLAATVHTAERIEARRVFEARLAEEQADKLAGNLPG